MIYLEAMDLKITPLFINSLLFLLKSSLLHFVFLLAEPGLFHGNKNTSQKTCVLVAWASYSHRDKVPTTIGARELNFRVRYGNGCDLSAIITKL